jgi:hypothetical protein
LLDAMLAETGGPPTPAERRRVDRLLSQSVKKAKKRL